MGDDLSQGTKIGIMLVILCSIVAIVLGLLSMMKNITNAGAATLQSGLDQMLQMRYDDYDQQQMSGTQVKSAIKLFEAQATAIVVKTGATQEASATHKGGYNYGAILVGYTSAATPQDGAVYAMAADITTKKKSGDTFYTIDRNTSTGAVSYNNNTRPTTRSGSEYYIRSSALYLAELIKDSTNEIVGICFTQVN